ncbi:unnamed protein product [Ambrosiozyma monospora]|uniref:Unnamed protein product n=1 Tax=Ambrosiozyma monospora TaxID=43982 RepID=A0ACB5SYY9_AMBMO|nr:unnamed protein product [Ambrosiozyma monospora]
MATQTTNKPLPKLTPGNLSEISPLILGGAIFNTQYNDDPFGLEIKKLILSSFENGINAIDTSPYYGPSEELIGKALHELTEEVDPSFFG